MNLNHCETAQHIFLQAYDKEAEVVLISEPHRKKNNGAWATNTWCGKEEILSMLVLGVKIPKS